MDEIVEVGGRVTGATSRGVCVLTHGINGLPDDLDELGAALRAQGYATEFLTLPGHQTTIHDFARHGWEEWLAAVEGAADGALAREAANGDQRPVFLIGHSLGAALTLAAAARRPRLAGVVAMCPPVRLAYAMEPAVGALRRVTPFIPAWGEDIRDMRRRLARRAIYRWSSTAAIHSLVRALPGLRSQLPQVAAPSLVIAARHDHVVPVRDGREAYELLGSAHKRLVVLERSYHAVARDVERHVVFERVSAFCEEVVETWPSRPAPPEDVREDARAAV